MHDNFYKMWNKKQNQLHSGVASYAGVWFWSQHIRHKLHIIRTTPENPFNLKKKYKVHVRVETNWGKSRFTSPLSHSLGVIHWVEWWAEFPTLFKLLPLSLSTDNSYLNLCKVNAHMTIPQYCILHQYCSWWKHYISILYMELHRSHKEKAC